MLIFFFSIPMFLVAVFVLGIAGLAFPALRTIIDIGNTIIDVIYNVASFGLILFIIGIGIVIIAPELSSRASKKRNIPLIVLGIYMCAISTLALLRIRILHRFSFVLLFSVIYLVLLSLIYILIIGKKSVIRYFFTAVGIFLSALPVGWVIGHDMNYTALVDQKNVAYYYCEDVLYEESTEAQVLYDDDGNVTGVHVDRIPLTGFIFQEEPSVDSAIGSYEKGDYLIPDRSRTWIKRKQTDVKYKCDMLWYPVFSEDGLPGYVRYNNLQVFYRGSGDWVEESRQTIIDNTWYQFCPKCIFSFGSKVFAVCPLGYSANIENDPSLYL